MASQKLDRARGTADCPLGIQVYQTHRIMPKFTFIHWHPDIELIYVVKGTYEFYSPEGLFCLSGGNFYLVHPGEDHAIRALEQSGTYWSVAFTLDMVSGNQNHYLQTAFVAPLLAGTLQMPRIIPQADPVFQQILAQILPLPNLAVGSDAYKLAAHVAANTICAAIAPKCQAKITPDTGCIREHNAAKTCVQYIHTHYAEKITVELLAQLVHLHPNYLCGMFKEHIGVSVINYINVQRLNAASNLLQTTNLSLQQIADRTGFNSVSYFSRMFRKQFGISPGAYAALYQKNQHEND